MSTDRHSHAEQKNLIEDPDERARQEAQNGLLQFELLVDTAKAALAGLERVEPFKLRLATITRLQEIALRGIHPLAGTFRNTPISISGSKHAPPDWPDVPEEVTALCSYVNEHFENKTAIHLAAYVLWKLNWIHPFSDGNGRTARAVSYLVLLIKLGAILPGTPTIPEQIAADKGPYYDALEAADAAAHNGVSVDVSALEAMIEGMLINQLTGRPSLPQTARKNVGTTFIDRIEKAPAELRKKCYGSEDVIHQLWSVGDHIVLQVGSKTELDTTDERSQDLGNPFPHLLAIGSAPAGETVGAAQKGVIQVGKCFAVNRDFALRLDPDTFLTLEGVSVQIEGDHDWSLSGTLYVTRMGAEIKEENLASVFDFLISKHLSVRAR